LKIKYNLKQNFFKLRKRFNLISTKTKSRPRIAHSFKVLFFLYFFFLHYWQFLIPICAEPDLKCVGAGHF